MDFDRLFALKLPTQEEFDRIEEGILNMAASTAKHYTWEEKIDNLAKLAKAAGSYINSRDELGSDYNNEAMFNLREAYEEFCQWRHDEPYVVDEIKELLVKESNIIHLKGKPEEEENPTGPFSRERQIEWQEKHRAEAEESLADLLTAILNRLDILESHFTPAGLDILSETPLQRLVARLRMQTGRR